MLKLQILMGLSSLTNSLNASGSCRYHLGIQMKYDINNSVPDYLFMTNANEHENHTLNDMQFIKDDTAAFKKPSGRKALLQSSFVV